MRLIGMHDTEAFAGLDAADQYELRALNAGFEQQIGNALVIYDERGTVVSVRLGERDGRQLGPRPPNGAEPCVFDMAEDTSDPGLGGPDGLTEDELAELYHSRRFWRERRRGRPSS